MNDGRLEPKESRLVHWGIVGAQRTVRVSDATLLWCEMFKLGACTRIIRRRAAL